MLPFFQTVDHLAAQFCPEGALLSYVGFAQFRKFDLKFEKEIIIRSKYWNISFCGKFFFFSCSFRLCLVTDIKLDCAKFTEEILENNAIRLQRDKKDKCSYTQDHSELAREGHSELARKGHSELTRTWRLGNIKIQ